MKAKRTIIPALLVMLALMTVMTGCKYESPTAIYYQPQPTTAIPTISGVNPANEALGGVNFITIAGSNFSSINDDNKVYFSGYQAEVVESSPSLVKVRRPSKTGDSLTIKLVTYGELQMASSGPYKISSVFGSYGGFLSGTELSAMTVDRNENLYVIDKSTARNIIMVPAGGGDQVIVGSVSKFMYDMQLSSDGTLVLLMNDARVRRKNLATGKEDTIAVLPKKTTTGDFDPNGNFYAAGLKTDLYVLKKDLSNTAANLYGAYNVRDLRVYQGYVYLLAENTAPTAENPAKGIWRQPILDANGTLGSKELFLDWSAKIDEVDSTSFTTLEASSDGKFYVGTDRTSPILMVDVATRDVDVLYKGILPTPAVQLVWGGGNSMYMFTWTMSGATKKWDVIRIDMGIPGAPYYGRN
jgi:hypothetical protein